LIGLKAQRPPGWDDSSARQTILVKIVRRGRTMGDVWAGDVGNAWARPATESIASEPRLGLDELEFSRK